MGSHKCLEGLLRVILHNNSVHQGLAKFAGEVSSEFMPLQEINENGPFRLILKGWMQRLSKTAPVLTKSHSINKVPSTHAVSSLFLHHEDPLDTLDNEISCSKYLPWESEELHSRTVCYCKQMASNNHEAKFDDWREGAPKMDIIIWIFVNSVGELLLSTSCTNLFLHVQRPSGSLLRPPGS